MNEPSLAADLTALAKRAQQLGESGRVLAAANSEAVAAYRLRMARASGSNAELVLADETALELGSPRSAAANAVLWTAERALVRDGRVTVLSPEFAKSEVRERNYAQFVLLGLEEGVTADPFRFEAIQFLTRRLPGVMARMVPGRLWLRVSRAALESGLDFALLAGALREAYLEAPGVAGVECIFASGEISRVEQWAGLAAEARILTGRHRKLSLGADGDYECEELNCDSCADKPVCDRIREVTGIRRRERSKLEGEEKEA